MKLSSNILKTHSSGILLIECVVYIAVFFVLLGVAVASFSIFWSHSTSLMNTTNHISAALRAGERWRAEVRAATGKILCETNSVGVLLTIPHENDKIYYSFHDGSIHRKSASANSSELLFEKVKTSEMQTEMRGDVTAWRWELELQSPSKQKLTPLAFTFEAATTIAP